MAFIHKIITFEILTSILEKAEKDYAWMAELSDDTTNLGHSFFENTCARKITPPLFSESKNMLLAHQLFTLLENFINNDDSDILLKEIILDQLFTQCGNEDHLGTLSFDKEWSTQYMAALKTTLCPIRFPKKDLNILTKVASLLKKAVLWNTENLKALISQAQYASNIKLGITMLKSHELLTQENVDILLLANKRALLIAEIINQLNEEELLTPENKARLIEYIQLKNEVDKQKLSQLPTSRQKRRKQLMQKREHEEFPLISFDDEAQRYWAR